MKTRLIASIVLLITSALCAQSDVIPLQKKRSDDTLNVSFKTGAKQITISSAGGLVWEAAAPLTGANYFREAAGLGLVENTSISVWAGSTNVTTLGTITTGVWQGTAIADAKIASAATWNAKENALTFSTGLSRSANTITLATTGITAGSYGSSTQVARLTIDVYGRVTAVSGQTITPAENVITFTDITTNNASTTKHGFLRKLSGNAAQYLDGTGAWSSPPSGITIGSTVISGGTSGRLLMSGDTVGELTLGSNVATWLTTPSEANLKAVTSGISWLDTAQTLSASSAVSSPARLISGSWYSDGSGTTTLPHILIQPSAATAATTWNTAGTGLAINGHAGTLFEVRTDGVGAGPYTPQSNFRVDADASVYFGSYKMVGGGYGSCTATGNLYYNSGAGIMFLNSANFGWNFDSVMYNGLYGMSPVTGVIWLTGGSANQELRIASNGTAHDDQYLSLKFNGTHGVISSTGNIIVASPLSIPRGSNARAGNVTLVAGTATVSNTTVTAVTLVIPVRKTAGGTIGGLTYTLTAGSSFTINSDSATDTSVISYLLIENP